MDDRPSHEEDVRGSRHRPGCAARHPHDPFELDPIRSRSSSAHRVGPVRRLIWRRSFLGAPGRGWRRRVWARWRQLGARRMYRRGRGARSDAASVVAFPVTLRVTF
jgi:hypothetical protein